MPKKNDSYASRSERRKNKGFDRFLNWAIGIVVVLIVLIGGYLLFNILHSPDTEASTTSTNNKSHEAKSDDTQDKAKSDSEAKGTESQDDSENVVPNDASQNPDDGSSATDSDDQSNEDSGGGPKGPWKPIGTTQSEPHQTNYDEGSVDWNERVKALSYATGISEEDMTLIWLGNGGAPDKSLGKVKDKQTGKIYDVILQWVKDKGWKPISVDPE
ncbi:cytoskeletal protein RodZ [Pullulanibacillus pueri]|uniref:Putative membrane protein YrrS n=1 Tax=Pullulanibacillus pueri TaxID=1437324 RepID=A0A8J3A2M1_9BACL|nr:YrrS family protein [Pullulanibacillus pueri]MBM7684231.1 cytoskeletal protein RodZ [Pullulanibacillus pueri]GGH89030.1 putative membrane protein YrrS [Pullulanibacillus pueri]